MSTAREEAEAQVENLLQWRDVTRREPDDSDVHRRAAEARAAVVRVLEKAIDTAAAWELETPERDLETAGVELVAAVASMRGADVSPADVEAVRKFARELPLGDVDDVPVPAPRSRRRLRLDSAEPGGSDVDSGDGA